MHRWVWQCPTCGQSGTAEACSFRRCYECDCKAERSSDVPPIQWTDNLQSLLNWTHENAIIEAMQIIEGEMERTSVNTGHGKAQRAFGRKLLEKLTREVGNAG